MPRVPDVYSASTSAGPRAKKRQAITRTQVQQQPQSSDEDDLEALAAEINQIVGDTKDSHLILGLRCYEFNALTAKKKKERREELRLDADEFSRYVRIGSNPKIYELDQFDENSLPFGYTNLCEIARMSESEIDDFVDQGLLHGKTRRRDIVAWRKKRRGGLAKKKTKSIRAIGFFGAEKLLSGDVDHEVDSTLRGLVEKFGWGEVQERLLVLRLAEKHAAAS